jgi:hypothetical protein
MKVLIAALAALAVMPAAAQARVFGVAGTPAQYLSLPALHPSVLADYVPFGSDVVPTLQTDRELHATAMFTWTSISTLSLEQVAAGDADAYIIRTAEAIRAYRGPVYIRFDQEMNGGWFSWGGDPAGFVAAWRHVWDVLHRYGASNARLIWGPDLLASETLSMWQTATAPYWPGSPYVSLVGPTMVEFAFESSCEVACRFERIDWLHATYAKPVWLAETKVDAAERYVWLRSLHQALAVRPWVTGVIWSLTPSRGQALGQPGVGNMDWQLSDDPFARSLLKAALAS